MQTYKEIEYSINETDGKWFYEIPEIGLSPQNLKPFVGGELTSSEMAQKTAQAHINIIMVERACNAQVVALVADMEAQKNIFMEELKNI